MASRPNPTSTVRALVNAIFCAALTVGLVIMGIQLSPIAFAYAGVSLILDVMFWGIYLRARDTERSSGDLDDTGMRAPRASPTSEIDSHAKVFAPGSRRGKE